MSYRTAAAIPPSVREVQWIPSLSGIHVLLGILAIAAIASYALGPFAAITVLGLATFAIVPLFAKPLTPSLRVQFDDRAGVMRVEQGDQQHAYAIEEIRDVETETNAKLFGGVRIVIVRDVELDSGGRAHAREVIAEMTNGDEALDLYLRIKRSLEESTSYEQVSIPPPLPRKTRNARSSRPAKRRKAS